MGLFQKPIKEKRGIKILVYGGSGVGKTVFTLSFPHCAVIDTEDGSSMYTENPNMDLRVVTTSAVDVEDAIDEIYDEYINQIDTVILDSETKMYENLQHSALVVVEKRARENGRSTFGEGISMKEWQKIKLIHKRINSKLIELSGLGKNIIMVTQLSDEKQQIGDQFVKIGEKPNGVKGLEYDFDIILKLCFDKEEIRRYGVVEKDRTGTFQTGEEIDNPSFENWKHIFEASKSLDAAKINFNKDVASDTKEFDDAPPEVVEPPVRSVEVKSVDSKKLDDIIDEINAVVKKKNKEDKTLSTAEVVKILTSFNVKKPKEITNVEEAQKVLEAFQAA